MESNNILQVINVSKHFKGFQVIDNLNLDLIQGEKHGLIGPNGAGKTTIFNLITGKYAPSKGKILFKNKRINNISPYKITQYGIARSFQTINIFKNLTVFENIQNAIVSRHRSNLKCFCFLKSVNAIRRDIDYVLERFNLTAFTDEVAENLGYGLQRRLEIGLTIALDPELILLDEPTAGMTPEEAGDIVSLIREITQKKSLIVIEHDMDVIFKIADRISVLRSGQIIATGTPEEIKRNSLVREVYLGGLFGGEDISNG